MRHKQNILVVEDDESIARGLHDLLKTEGYGIRLADNGNDGLRKALTSPPDLILLDVNLPKLGGVEVCRQLRERSFHRPIIMLTARKEQVDKVVGLESGADDYITKPFAARELLARIHAHMRAADRLHQTPVIPSATPRKQSWDRRLLSVMFIDMKDFSRTMNKNEALALQLLERHNTKVRYVVNRWGGRIIEVIGDAFLISFESALSAIQCGLSLQRNLKKYNLLRPAPEQIQIRIGIHLGDVTEVDGRLRGDAINVAARLQQIATPGHLFFSGSVFEAVRGKLTAKVIRLGIRHVKHIRQPIVVYSIEA